MVDVREVANRNRFEVLVDHQVVGFAVYHEEAGLVTFPHTEVAPPYQGQGIGAELVRVALDTVRGRGQHVLPYCSFVADYIAQHQDYLDIVPDRERARFGLAILPDEAASPG